VDEIVNTVKMIAPGFGGINLEDISGPRCFEIERRLKEELDIPVFHDDQHGTAVVSLAAIINAVKIAGKKITDLTVVINGAGAAGVAIGKLLLKCGVRDVIMCNSKGAVYEGKDGLNAEVAELAKITNKNKLRGSLADVAKNTDVLIGVSVAGAFSPEIVKSMNTDPIILAMANPVPEIFPIDAAAAGAKVVGTGRSDFNNQINNVLAFPGIFRGALDVRASEINDEMKIAAAEAIAGLVSDAELNPGYIIPAPFDERVGKAVAAAVAKAAVDTGVNRI
jgi:malate dehydrogenase (oxaloacetate-decarboxylating)